MTMIEIMKKLNIKKAEWKDVEPQERIKLFDKRIDRKYMKEFSNHKEYGFFNETKNNKLVADGWKPVCDSDYQPVRIKKEYYVNTKGEIFRLVKSMNCYKPVLSFEQMMIGDKIVDKNDYLG